MNRAVMFSSKRQDWTTPDWIYNQLHNEFKFTLDPCCYPETAKCKKYYTKKENGLIQDWAGERVYVNPPFGSAISKWVAKSYKESLKPKPRVVMLIPARTDTSYWHKWIFGKADAPDSGEIPSSASLEMW